MSFLRSLKTSKLADHSRSCSQMFSHVQRWSYYRDLAIQSGHCTVSSELASLRHSRLQRSFYSLVYTPNDELDYFTLYLESRSLSFYLTFVLEVNAFEKVLRANSTDDQQTLALAFFHKYLSLDANHLVPITDEIRQATLSLICPSENSTQPDPNCFQIARDHVWQLLEQSAYQSYSQSSFHVSYQLKMLTSNQGQLHDFLHHNSALPYLLKFAEHEHITDLIRFWIDVQRFYQKMIDTEVDNQTLLDNALLIYDQYISLQAPSPLGFDDAIRTKIECSICQPDLNAGPSTDTFDQAAWIVYTILQREYFPRFLRSLAYYRYITDLMGQLRPEEFTPHSRRVSTPDLGKDHLHKTASTGIDSENVPQLTSSNRQRNMSTSSACLSVHSETEVQPRGRLSMGYIDSLGRFIRDPDVDSIDGSSTGSRQSSSKPLQFLTQFVRNEPDARAEEEAASRFAETFINEITNRTSNSHDH